MTSLGRHGYEHAAATMSRYAVRVEAKSSWEHTNGGHCGDDEAPAAAGLRMHGAQLGVLPHDAGILLMQADRLLDLKGLSCTAEGPPQGPAPVLQHNWQLVASLPSAPELVIAVMHVPRQDLPNRD